jgi:hypothetical protein
MQQESTFLINKEGLFRLETGPPSQTLSIIDKLIIDFNFSHQDHNKGNNAL